MTKTSDKRYPNILGGDLLAALSCAAKQNRGFNRTLEAIHVKFDGETLMLESTDTYKLVHIERHALGMDSFEVLLDARSVKSAGITKTGHITIDSIDEHALEGWFMPKRGSSKKVYIETLSTETYVYPKFRDLLVPKATKGAIALPLLNPEYTASVLKAASMAFPDMGATIIPQGMHEPTIIKAAAKRDRRDNFTGLVMPLKGNSGHSVSVAKDDSKDVQDMVKRIEALEQENKTLHEAWDAVNEENHELRDEITIRCEELTELSETLDTMLQKEQQQPKSTWGSAFVSARPSALYESTQMVPA